MVYLLEKAVPVLIGAVPFLLVCIGSYSFIKLKRKIGIVLFVIGLIILAGFSIIGYYSPYSPIRIHCENGESCITNYEKCVCFGSLSELFSNPPLYGCAGTNLCIPVDETTCSKDYTCITNISDCSRYSNMKNCLQRIAFNARELSTCYQSNDSFFRVLCVSNVAVIKKDPDYCNSLPYEDKVSCVKMFFGKINSDLK